ncbi:lysine N(6)-hydroxylase/L-ornithine N(5)-oxygenase family protein [Plantactinospora mayteni]|uniref:L-lysine N6-monooxygenase MbtG n=1 Tax=Plantactinospora mayteni TaxID=566021 RepID=A0ABQ4EJC8_9ACTN|nr:lysine N(6)-hydroxylase/L-ornithine N(5)-oxygenase family protein [Plantactinospora mayteni]GIG94836.1 lysine/ornithine N-monooxygenase [Plantactinospora mayteni]
MSRSTRSDDPQVHDLLGIGFGPSNLALAIAIREATAGSGRIDSAVFLERQPSFGWHRGMLLDDATMQVSFLKDLVTLRNPASGFSFLCYLQSRGRLIDFINHKNLFPSRVEFHDYLEWAAAQVDDLVRYGHDVVDVRPVWRDGELDHFEVLAQVGPCSAAPVSYRARNLVLGVGLRPYLPDGITLDTRVWHSRDLLPNLRGLVPSEPSRFVVVGAGQSAAEAVDHLHREFPAAEVCAVFSRYGYSPADDSSFANRIFDPAAVQEYFTAPPEVKEMMLSYHGNTNYSVVDQELIDELYRRVYQEKVRGIERLRILNLSRLVETVRTPEGVRMVVESLVSNEKTVLDADVVVFATGYRPVDPFDLLGEAAEVCLRDDAGRALVDRDYRLRTRPEVRAGIYLQGGTEHSHGISSSLLSNTAVRAAEILGAICARSADPALDREPEYAGAPGSPA